MTESLKVMQEEFDVFLDIICPSLQLKVQRHIFKTVLKINPVISLYIERQALEDNPDQKLVNMTTRQSFMEKFKSKFYKTVPQQEQGDEFLEDLVRLLGIVITVPEETLIQQDNPGSSMYFISKGNCVVNIYDKDMKNRVAIRLLNEGDHFGEISLLYKCNRTCTVVSRNYNTIARCLGARFRMLCSDHPMFRELLVKHVHRYKDPILNYMRSIISKISYFQNLLPECLH